VESGKRNSISDQASGDRKPPPGEGKHRTMRKEEVARGRVGNGDIEEGKRKRTRCEVA